MSVTMRYSVRCTKCNGWLQKLEEEIDPSIPRPTVDGPGLTAEKIEAGGSTLLLPSNGKTYEYFTPLSESLEDWYCPHCGVRLLDLISVDNPNATYWRMDWSEEVWLEFDEPLDLARAFPNGRPAVLRKHSGEVYNVAALRCYERLSISQVPEEGPSFPESLFGRYVLATDRGDIAVECRPGRNEDGTPDFGSRTWHLVGVREDSRPKPPPETEIPPSLYAPEANVTAYRWLYEVESKLRWFVHEVMRGKYGERWWEDEQFWRGMADKGGIRNVRDAFQKAAERQEEERQHLYVVMRSADLFAYLELRNLREVMETFSGDFSALVPKQRILFGMLESLETIRNALAHNRPLSQEALLEVRKAQGIVKNLVIKAEGS